MLDQFTFEILPVEMWKAPGHRERTDIHQHLNPVGFQRRNEFVNRTRGVTDRVKRRQEQTSVQGRQCGDYGCLLLGKYGPQVEQDSAFFHAGDDRRVVRAFMGGSGGIVAVEPEIDVTMYLGQQFWKNTLAYIIYDFDIIVPF